MHGASLSNPLPTAFVPSMAKPLQRSAPAGAIKTTPTSLAFSNPLGKSLVAGKALPGFGMKDLRSAQQLPPRLVSLRAHANDKGGEPLSEDEELQALADSVQAMHDALVKSEDPKGPENKDNPENEQDKAAEGKTGSEIVPAGDVEGKDNGFKNPLPGVEIGIPLNILASFFSSLRYGESVLEPSDMFLQACLGYMTYGTDRLLDAYSETGEISDDKKALYADIKKNTGAIMAAIGASTIHAFNTLNERPETRPFIPLLASTFLYKQLKENCGPIKPMYIAAMWTAACVILPAVMHDHDFSILASPQDYLPAALLMFGSTNLADTKDIAEDMEKGIETLPVKLGKPVADIMSYAALGTAALMIGSQLLSQMG